MYAPLPELIPVSLRDMLPVNFPKLIYLYLGHWEIPWRWFTGFMPVNLNVNGSSLSPPAAYEVSTVGGKEKNGVTVGREQPNLRFNSVKTFIFWKCSGLPTSVVDVLEKAWVAELKEVWGEGLEVYDDSIGLEKALKGNKGGGVW